MADAIRTAQRESSNHSARSPQCAITVSHVARTRLHALRTEAVEESEGGVAAPAAVGRKADAALAGWPRCSAKISIQYPQKSPQWPGHFPPRIVQVLNFDRAQKLSYIQPFGCSQKLPTFYKESVTYGPRSSRRAKVERWEE
jgi:hypothetical protein